MTREPERGHELAALIEDSLDELYENAPCGYVTTLPDGTLVRANRTFLDWSGYDRSELLSRRRFQDLLTVGCRIYYETHFAPLLQMQDFVHEVALDLKTRDGGAIPVLVNSRQKRDEAGNPMLIRTTVFNVTERRQYERELLAARRNAEQSARSRADLLAMISHDIRTPLGAMLGALHMLKTTGLDSKQERYVNVLRSSSDHLMALVNQILDYSRIEAGKVTVDEHVFDLRQLAGDIVSNLAVRAEEKQIRLELSFDPRVPATVAGDAMKISQVLMNLLGNAVKFTERGMVTLEVGVVEAQSQSVLLQFSVTDTGIGIPEDRLGHIFDGFTQASRDVEQRFGGSGLGLTISRRLLELLGTSIGVTSTVGVGSTFSFQLRLRTVGAQPG